MLIDLGADVLITLVPAITALLVGPIGDPVVERHMTDKDIFLKGFAAAMRYYAINRDGEKFIGVMGRPLEPEITKLPDDTHIHLLYLEATSGD